MMNGFNNNTKIALALSSGGAKGYAHIGVIKAIEETGAKITSVAGTSMGALIGGLYAAGKLDAAYSWLKTIDATEMFILADFGKFGINGLTDGEKIIEKLHQFIGDVLIDDLPIPFCAIATDLDLGIEVVINHGRLIDAIRASISLPGVFKPYKIIGRRTRLVDGGLVNGLPINRLKRNPGDVVVAVNLDTYGFCGKMDLKSANIASLVSSVLMRNKEDNIIDILLNSFYISLKQNKLAMVERIKPDVYLNIDLKGYSTHNFADAKIIADLGYKQMKSAVRCLYGKQ